MIWERMKRGWCAAIAVCCVLIASLPAVAGAQQPPAPQHAYLGAGLRDLTRQEAAALGQQAPRGAAVKNVEANSPAAAAGLRRGDIVVEINGQPVANTAQFLKLIAGKTPGTVVTLRLLRQGKLRAGPVKLGKQPEGQVAADAGPAKPVPAAAVLAVTEVPERVQQSPEPAAEHVNHPAAGRYGGARQAAG